MKRIGVAMLAIFLLSQCTEKAAEKTNNDAVVVEEVVKIKLVSEVLQPYALTPIDSVYSVAIKLSSVDSALVQYNVTLLQGTEVFKDSLVFHIPAGDQIAGEFIFPACRVKNNPKPTFTSQIKELHDH